MMIVRPVRADDLDSLQQMAAEAGRGMSNLPSDRGLLVNKIRLSQRSFARHALCPAEDLYLFVMEDTDSGRVVGTSGIMCGIGRSRPLFSFKIIRRTHTSRAIGRTESMRLLQLVNDYEDVTEIGVLFLTPTHRRDGNGKLLSRSRYLFMAQFPERFSDPVMAEMRGVHDDNDRSPLWDYLGSRFTHLEFSVADHLIYQGNYQVVADLLPEYPIYLRLLAPEARAVLGRTHPETRPALAMLKREGFRFENLINILDGGPQLHVPLESIQTVRASRLTQLAEGLEDDAGIPCLLSNTLLPEFRICRGQVHECDDGSIQVAPETADALLLSPGDTLRYVPA